MRALACVELADGVFAHLPPLPQRWLMFSPRQAFESLIDWNGRDQSPCTGYHRRGACAAGDFGASFQLAFMPELAYAFESTATLAAYFGDSCENVQASGAQYGGLSGTVCGNRGGATLRALECALWSSCVCVGCHDLAI